MSDAIKQKEYEIAFLVKEEQDAQNIKQDALRLGFSITEQGETKRITLAYPIEKEQGAWFGFFRATAASDAIKGLSDELSLNASCIRNMIVSDPPQKTVERPMRPLSGSQRPTIRKQEISQKEIPAQTSGNMVTNEELEKKLEEILK